MRLENPTFFFFPSRLQTKKKRKEKKAFTLFLSLFFASSVEKQKSLVLQKKTAPLLERNGLKSNITEAEQGR
jgi:hypothetical protein